MKPFRVTARLKADAYQSEVIFTATFIVNANDGKHAKQLGRDYLEGTMREWIVELAEREGNLIIDAHDATA